MPDSVRRTATIIGLVTMLAVLAACSDSNGPADQAQASNEPTATPTSAEPAVETDARYGTVSALRDAAIEAGLSCPNWKNNNKVDLAAESGTCSGDSVLATFASEGDLQAQIETYRELNDFTADMGLDPESLLIGPNWIINSQYAAELQTVLGGTVEKS